MASLILLLALLVAIVYGWPLWAILVVAAALLLAVVGEAGSA